MTRNIFPLLMLATFCHCKQPKLESFNFAKDLLFAFFLSENEIKGSSEGFFQSFFAVSGTFMGIF